MNTITKIGRVSLTRLFHSSKFRAGKIVFPTRKFRLEICPYTYISEEHGGPEKVDTVSYHLWGIELGFRELKVGYSQKFREAVTDFISGNQNKLGTIFPSHIVVYSCRNGDSVTPHEEHFTVFRLSPEQCAWWAEKFGIHAPESD